MAQLHEEGFAQDSTSRNRAHMAHVESLAGETFPHGSEKLAGSEHTYRIRIGD